MGRAIETPCWSPVGCDEEDGPGGLHPAGGADDPEALERRWEVVEAKLLAVEAWLREQGSLVRKEVDGRSCWVVRVTVSDGGRRRHRSIYVTACDVELLRRTRATLARYRSEGRDLRRFAGWLSMVGEMERSFPTR